MNNKDIQAFLALVEKPSQYVGSEINSIRKNLDKIDVHIALAFPDVYEIGTSHFGIQILYNILNQKNNIAAERVFAPQTDMVQLLRDKGALLSSLETQTPLKEFDILGFSLLYELNFTNVLLMMDLAGLPFYAEQRDASYPIIIAGGPCTCNPEPVAAFFDAMVIGDGEEVLLDLCETYHNWKSTPGLRKDDLLKAWSKIPGIYIPRFFNAIQTPEGFTITSPKGEAGRIVSRAIVSDLNATQFPEAPIVPWGKPVHDRLRLEISRGCSRGCRFCQAGMIYRPVRERSLERLLSLSTQALKNTGYEDLSLLSLSTGDYSCLVPLMERLMINTLEQPTAISLPSIRAETLTPNLMNLIKKVRKTGFTIAPEAGTQRLRDVINKNITQQDVIDTVTEALNLGWQNIKLYFMVGLPTETMDDLQGIVDLVKTLLTIKGKSKKPQMLSVSVATFIPKPHTPFQWAKQADLEEARQKIQWLKDRLHLSRVKVKWQNPEVSLIEGLWARGDRRLAGLLVKAYEKGCLFDGWSDKFRFDLWQQAISETDLDVDFFTTRQRSPEEPLPWDHVDIGVTKTFLIKEWEKSHSGEATPDCRWGDCSACGVCDHKRIAPKIYDPNQWQTADSKDLNPSLSSEDYKKICLIFSKTGGMRFLSHLELANIMIRTLRRSKISLKYSEGFHPKPKLSFKDALPVGMQSVNEAMVLMVHKDQDIEEIKGDLNTLLCPGIKILSVHKMEGKKDLERYGGRNGSYMIVLKDGFFSQKDLDLFNKQEACLMTRVNKKGKGTTLNLKNFIAELSLISPVKITMTLQPFSNMTIRPADVLRQIFHLSEEQVKLADVQKH